jgi:hypothetical protein
MNRKKLYDILLYMLAYALLLVTMAVSVVAVLESRSTLNVLWAATGHSSYTLGLADQLSLLLGGLAAFVYTVFLETYYRASVAQRGDKDLRATSELGRAARPRGQVAQWLVDAGLDVLLRRFAWTAAIPAGVLIVSLALRPMAFDLLR